METGTLVIGTLIALFCIVPFGIAIMKNYKNKNNIGESLKLLALSKNTQLSEIETCRELGISISLDNQFIFFNRMSDSNPQTEIIEINKIAKCELIKVKSNNNSELTIFQKMELQLTPKLKNENPISLLIYQAQEYAQLNGELQLAEKWNKKVNSLL